MPTLIPFSVKNKMVNLRRTGHSIPEIAVSVKRPKSSVWRIVKQITVFPQYEDKLRIKQGGSKERAKKLRDETQVQIKRLIGKINTRDSFFLLVGLYWGEGAKRDFSLINSDPLLIRVVITCLRRIGITNDRFQISLRVHDGISITESKKFWSHVTGLPVQKNMLIEVVDGKKKGKLPYGMCRLRIRSGIRERILIQQAIDFISKENDKRLVSSLSRHSSMDRTRDS